MGMKNFLALIVINLIITSCQSSTLPIGVNCDEIQGSVTPIRLGPNELDHGWPYTIDVYLPPCYEAEAEREYPILYLFPGRGSNPDTWFNAGVGDVADRLILSWEIPPLIIVALENVEGDLMATNFAENIFPYVESHYRILPGSRYHAIGGGSMGGAPSYRIAFRHPDWFSSIALFGSGIILGEEERVHIWLNAIPSDQLPRIFLNTGFQDDLLLPRAEEFANIVREHQIEPYTIFSDGAHHYEYWVSNFPTYLEWLAMGW
jgi:enterochelin esterase-like enzyme